MSWVRIDDHFYDHAKWADAPGDSIALWLASMAWCNRNDSFDGYIPAAKLAGLVNVKNVKRTATDLCDRHAFNPHLAGFLIHEYAEYQQNDKVKAIREKRSAAGRKGASVRWGKNGKEVANAIANGWQDDGNENAPPPTTPLTGISEQTDSEIPEASSSLGIRELARRAAEELWPAEMKRKGIEPKKQNAWVLGTSNRMVAERTAEIQALQDSGATVDDVVAQLAGRVKTPSPYAGREAWYANPECQICSGDGLAPDEDNRLGACECRRAEPYGGLASVHHLRPAQ